MKKLVDEIIEKDYAEFHYRFLHFLCRHMLDISSGFDGDLDQFLILLVLDERYWKWRHEVADIEHPLRHAELEPLSITKLATVTSIPRETVRRKMMAMEARGWVVQVSRGKWQVARDFDRPSVEQELDGLVRKEIARVCNLVLELQDYVKRPDGWRSRF